MHQMSSVHGRSGRPVLHKTPFRATVYLQYVVCNCLAETSNFTHSASCIQYIHYHSSAFVHTILTFPFTLPPILPSQITPDTQHHPTCTLFSTCLVHHPLLWVVDPRYLNYFHLHYLYSLQPHCYSCLPLIYTRSYSCFYRLSFLFSPVYTSNSPGPLLKANITSVVLILAMKTHFCFTDCHLSS